MTQRRREYLMIPGPTPVPAQVLAAMARPMINHRGKEFAAIFNEVTEGVKKVFQTQGDVLIFPSAGTGGLEAAVVNFFSPGDKVLAVSIGVFGDRFAEIASTFGLDVEKIDVPWGQAAEPAVVEARLAGDREHKIKGILVTHHETSTGVENNIQAVSRARGDHPALLLVDAVSSLGAMDLQTDNWRVDVVITASQKALMVPPGLALLSANDRAWVAQKASRMPRYYWDLAKAKKSAGSGQTPYTPALSQLYALQESLRLIEEEGLQNIFERHRRITRAVRAGVRAMGLELLASDAAASTGVTAVVVPEGASVKDLRAKLSQKYGVTLAGGQKQLEGKIFRIGHLGHVDLADVIVTLSAIELALKELGRPVEIGAAVRAAEEVLAKDNAR